MSRRLAERFPWIWAAICMLLVIGAAALAIGWYGATKASSAGSHADHVAKCVNTDLGKRNQPASADAAAHIAFAQAQTGFATSLVTVLTAPKADGPAAFQAFLGELKTYEAQVATYARTLAIDQAQRTSNPLGKC